MLHEDLQLFGSNILCWKNLFGCWNDWEMHGNIANLFILKIMYHHLKCARYDFEDQEEINKEKETKNYLDYPHDPEARTLRDRYLNELNVCWKI